MLYNNGAFTDEAEDLAKAVAKELGQNGLDEAHALIHDLTARTAGKLNGVVYLALYAMFRQSFGVLTGQELNQ